MMERAVGGGRGRGKGVEGTRREEGGGKREKGIGKRGDGGGTMDEGRGKRESRRGLVGLSLLGARNVVRWSLGVFGGSWGVVGCLWGWLWDHFGVTFGVTVGCLWGDSGRPLGGLGELFGGL